MATLFRSAFVSNLLLMAFLFLVLASSPTIATCDYALNCVNEKLSGTKLSASCESTTGALVASSIDLNVKVGNLNGQLICAGQNYAQTCYNVALSGTHNLVADCRAGNGELVHTSLELNVCISNVDGYLKFCV
ncbi:hypothetical protein KP509_03G068900 [Ceratopteris richardii]|uniref:Cyanovirin-N domain-containing protein n=1 Tax=Ceratopteris richardii TaxID=49495 RepID=A0A8T2V7V2_CERRI|nr:hypothetical protein KP509_03G068900 [Ceratopteris richardii]